MTARCPSEQARCHLSLVVVLTPPPKPNTLQIRLVANLAGLADLQGFGPQRRSNSAHPADLMGLSPICKVLLLNAVRCKYGPGMPHLAHKCAATYDEAYLRRLTLLLICKVLL